MIMMYLTLMLKIMSGLGGWFELRSITYLGSWINRPLNVATDLINVCDRDRFVLNIEIKFRTLR